MKNKLKLKIASVLTGVVILASSISFPSYAAGMSVGSASGNVGDTVTINVSVSTGGAIGSTQGSLSYDPSALQYVGGGNTSGGGGGVNFTNAGDGNSSSLGFSVSFKILKEGSHSVSGSATVYDFDENVSSASGGGSVSGRSNTPAPTPTPQGGGSSSGSSSKPADKPADKPAEKKDEKSKNTALKSLSIAEGSLEPGFSADVTAYTVYVPEETTEVTVEAAAQDAKSSVAVAGNTELQPGLNEVTVTVKAESGDTRTYTISVVCGEDPAIIKVDEKSYRILKDIADEEIPAGFVRATENINETDFEVLSKEDGSMILVMVSSEDEVRALYMFFKEDGSLYPYAPIALSEENVVVPMPLDKDAKYPSSLKETVVTIGGKEFEALQGKDTDFYYINVMKADGTTAVYKYDSVENTYQRFNLDDLKVPKKSKKDNQVHVIGNLNLSKAACGKTIIALAVVCLMLAIALIVLICETVKMTKKKADNIKKIHKDDSDEEFDGEEVSEDKDEE